MKITTKLAIAIGCATLAACGGANEADETENLDANLMMTDNTGMMTDNNMVVTADNVTVVENGADATDLNTTNTMDLNTTNNTQ